MDYNWESMYDSDLEIRQIFFDSNKSLHWSNNYMKSFIRQQMHNQKQHLLKLIDIAWDKKRAELRDILLDRVEVNLTEET